MEHGTKPIVYDHIAISNLARRERAKVLSQGMSHITAWVARRWTALFHRRGQLPA